jgi:3-deoxy-D-manno-octulosonic-acid transferase
VPNPLVAAALGSSVIHGPKVNEFKELYLRMMEGGASVSLEREKDLSSKLVVLMAPDQCAEMAKKGWQVVSDGAVAIDRLVDFILDKMNLEK